MTKSTLIIGVGGAGTKISNNINQELNFDLLLVNTDISSLKNYSNKNILHVDLAPNELTANSPALTSALLNSELERYISGKERIIIISGFGGKAGTFISSEIVNIATKHTLDINLLATLPFTFEGKRRALSLDALSKLKESSTINIIKYDNENLAKNKNLTLNEVFETANKEIFDIIKNI
ncbi:hypothetical protein ACUM5Y_06770 [Marinomonas dokdonensis]|uniref:hypothetical protein n=1 Tax=Marinomonas dokdonensis TaxID=328224 RepID=UPI0040554A27